MSSTPFRGALCSGLPPALACKFGTFAPGVGYGLRTLVFLQVRRMWPSTALTLSVLRGNADLSFGIRSPNASRSTSSWTKNDSVNGFFFFNAFMAARRKRNESTVWQSSGRLFRYWTNTLAATYKQKEMKGFICKLHKHGSICY